MGCCGFGVGLIVGCGMGSGMEFVMVMVLVLLFVVGLVVFLLELFCGNSFVILFEGCGFGIGNCVVCVWGLRFFGISMMKCMGWCSWLEIWLVFCLVLKNRLVWVGLMIVELVFWVIINWWNGVFVCLDLIGSLFLMKNGVLYMCSDLLMVIECFVVSGMFCVFIVLFLLERLILWKKM